MPLHEDQYIVKGPTLDVGTILLPIFAKLRAMSEPFAIDGATGRIRFPDLRLELCPGMPEVEFVRASSGLNRDNLGANDGWQRYSVRELVSGERRLGLFVVFLNGVLVKASIAYGPKDETWANWSQQTHTARRNEYQQALEAQLGGKNGFPWGKADVIEDSKGGGTDIWIDYGESPA